MYQRAENQVRLVVGAVAGAIACLVGLAGCSADYNNRNTLGDARMTVSPGDARELRDRTVQLPAVSGNARLDAGVSNEKPAGAQPVIGSNLGREDWGRTTVLLPIDGVQAYPTYSRWRERAQETSRQRNEYPTPMTALELDGGQDEQTTEVLVAGMRSLGGGALVPFRMLMHRPWQSVRHVPQPGNRAAAATAQRSSEELRQLRKLDGEVEEMTAPVK